MATMPIYNMTDLWNSGGTTYDAIKMNVTDSASAAASRLMTLQVGSVDKAYITKAGAMSLAGALAIGGALTIGTNDGGALGASGTAFSDLFLADGGVINWNAGDVTATGGSNLLAFAGASNGYTFDKKAVVGHTANLSIGGNADNLEIFGTDAATGGVAIGMFSATAGTGPHLDFYRSKDGTMATATVVASGDLLGAVNAYGAQQTGTFATQTMAAQIRFEVSGTVTSGGSGDMPGRIVFATTADGGSAVTDRLILDNTGVLKPNANDGVALGTTALGFSDLFLATGGVVNWNNGEMTLSEAAGTITITYGDAGASAGPVLQLYRDSASPAVNDTIGKIEFLGRDSGAAQQSYGHIQYYLDDPTGGSEDSGCTISINIAGAATTVISADGTRVFTPNAFRVGQDTTSVPGSGNNTAGSAMSSGTFSSNTASTHTLGKTSDGTILNWSSGGTTQGSVSVSGATITYGTFNGSHEAQLVDGVDRSKLLRGTIIDSVDEQCNWYGYPDQVLSKVKISDKPGSKRVYGVFFDWFNSDPKEDTTNTSSLGAYVIRIAKGEIVEGGDLIESNGDGCGRVMRDHSLSAIEVQQRLVAKITSTVVAETYPDGSYLLPCTLHCG